MVRLLISILGDMGCNIETTTAASDERKAWPMAEQKILQSPAAFTVSAEVSAL